MIKGINVDLESLLKPIDSEAWEDVCPCNEDATVSFIKYKSKVFIVRNEDIFRLSYSKKHLTAVIKREKKNGIGFVYPDGITSCGYCNHYDSSTVKIILDRKLGPIMIGSRGNPGVKVDGCTYKRKEDVLWASTFKYLDTNFSRVAVRTPCVMYDSIVAALADAGALRDFESKQLFFDFPTIGDLLGKPELVQNYELERKKGFFSRLIDYIKR